MLATGRLAQATVVTGRTAQVVTKGGQIAWEGYVVSGKGTKTDRLKEHLTYKDLDAARREKQGEIVVRKKDGTPFNHIQEVQEAQQGLLRRIRQIKTKLSSQQLSQTERLLLEQELSEASKLLDYSERFLAR